MIIAIDPGASGGIVVGRKGQVISVCPMLETETDVVSFIRENIEADRVEQEETVCVIEKVGGYAGGPGQPGSAMFGFGKNVGIIYGALMMAQVKIIEVTPQKWQKALSLGTKSGMEKTEWKNKLKAMAQRLYPTIKVTLKTADALLIFEYSKYITLL
jgi:hypothetical protein